MNVLESNDVCTLFAWMGLWDWPGRTITNDEAREAAVHLAERAHRHLSAGVTADDVRARWARLTDAIPPTKGT